MNERNYRVRLGRVRSYVKEKMPKLQYHNFEHAEDVQKVVANYALMEGLPQYKIFLSATSGVIHDLVSVVGASNNEENTAQLSRQILPYFGYSQDEAGFVSNQIMATKPGRVPSNIYEMIMHDADLDNLGREDFLKRNYLLRKEQGKLNIPDFQWFTQTLDFLQSHKYYTKTAQNGRNKGLEKNKLAVREILENIGGLEYAA